MDGICLSLVAPNRSVVHWLAVTFVAMLPHGAQGAETSDQLDENAIRTEATLESLRSLVDVLVRKVEKLETERSQVTAPFTVVDDSGTPILVVEATPTPRLMLGSGSGGRAELRILASDGAVMNFSDGSGQVHVSLFTEPGQALLAMSGGGMNYNLGTDDNGRTGLAIGRDGHVAAAIDAAEGGASLEVYDAAGKAHVSLSSGELSFEDESGVPAVAIQSSDAAGQPSLSFAGPAGNVLQLGVDQSGTAGYLSMLDEVTERITLHAGSEEPIRVVDANDKAVLTARDDATGPRLSIGDAVAGTASLELGVGDGGRSSYLTMFDDTTERVSLAAGTKSPIRVQDAEDRGVLEVRDDVTGPGLFVGQAANGAWVELGLGNERTTSYLSLNDHAAERVTLRADSAESALALHDAQDRPYFSVGLPEDTARAAMTLGEPGGARIQMGVNDSNKGVHTMWVDGAGVERASVKLDDDGQAGLYVTENEKTFVSVRHNPESGSRVAVGNNAGKAVTGLLATEAGGRVVVTGAEGGDSLAALYAQGSGGELRLWDTSKKARATLSSDGSGHLTVTGNAGSVTLDAADEASPLVEISDGAGTNLVRAGISSGVGVVLTGPNGNGPAGTMGAGLKSASSIEGKRN